MRTDTFLKKVISFVLSWKGSVLLFVLSAFLVLIITPLFQKGSFIDAMLYKTVAYNFSTGNGTFWSMKYTNTSMQFFCEQPPLYPALLGSFYSWLGTHYLVDRFFTFLQLIILFAFIWRICKKLFSHHNNYFLLVSFFLVTVQVFCWTFANQVIETLVILICAIALDVFLDFNKRGRLLSLVMFAIFILLLFLAKGFQSCFLLVLPLTYYALNKNLKKPFLYYTVAILIVLGLIWALLVYFVPAVKWYQCYYQARLVLTMQNVGATTRHHYDIVLKFFVEALVPLLITAGLVLYLKIKKQYPLRLLFQKIIKNTFAISFLITAMAGSLPFALSLVQRAFYLVPAYLSFSLFILIGFKPYWYFWFRGIARFFSKKGVQLASFFLFTLALIYFLVSVHTYKREEPLASDLEIISPYFKKGDKVMIRSDVWNYFNLHSCLYMQKEVSLSAEHTFSGFLIAYKSDPVSDEKGQVKKINLPTRELDLYYFRPEPKE